VDRYYYYSSGGQHIWVKGSVCFAARSPGARALGDAAPGRHERLLQGDVDIVVGSEKQGHIGEGATDADRLNIGRYWHPSTVLNVIRYRLR
jgi:hypothetical protein